MGRRKRRTLIANYPPKEAVVLPVVSRKTKRDFCIVLKRVFIEKQVIAMKLIVLLFGVVLVASVSYAYPVGCEDEPEQPPPAVPLVRASAIAEEVNNLLDVQVRDYGVFNHKSSIKDHHDVLENVFISESERH